MAKATSSDEAGGRRWTPSTQHGGLPVLPGDTLPAAPSSREIAPAIGAGEAAPNRAATAGLPLPAKLLYSVSSLGGEALIQGRGAWLLYYYAPPADSGLPTLLPLGLIGILLALRLVDSFDEALIGYWSDRTRSRLGRRLPFVLAGAPLWAIFAVLTVIPPADGSTARIAVYFALTTELYGMFATVAGGPYEALLPEIAPTQRGPRADRSSSSVFFGLPRRRPRD